MTTEFGEFSINKVLISDSGLKDLVVEYIGNKLNPDNGEVTLEMAIEAFAVEFPELLITIAEENYLRGYEKALDDVNSFNKLDTSSANNGTK
jgi:hypothetical protein|tara:strand:+ start:844 stop:1119 length:276 start_codon:yes stop_codon:yes gene_type:complete